MCSRPLQVIAKLNTLEIEPGEAYEGGRWHVEGTLDDRIVATACCYLDSENVEGGELEFRTSIHAPDHAEGDHRGVQQQYGLSNGDPLVQSRGQCTTFPGRVLAWPNTLEHRVRPVRLIDPSKPGRRTICCFLLVDPTLRVRSTATVPPQQHAWVANEVHRSIGHVISEGAVQKKISDMLVSSSCLIYEQACERRNRMVEERRHQGSRQEFIGGERFDVPERRFYVRERMIYED